MKFVDAHTHLEFFALKGLPIERAASKRDLIEMIESVPGKQLVSWGWSEERLGEPVTRKDIDRFPFSILLIRIDAHVGVLNRRAIDELRLPSSERFDAEKGYVYEEVLWNAASALKPKDMGAFLMKAQEDAISKDIIEVHDFVDAGVAETYFKLREEGNLKLNVVLMPYYEDYLKVLNLFDRYGEDAFIRLGWIKVFVDGSIGARTAFLREPYQDKPSSGILLKTEDELRTIIEELEKKGLRVALHAIGDGAIEVVLDAFEEGNFGLKGHRIEHGEMINSEQARRVKELGITLSVQPNFNVTFMETYVKALGEERANGMNPIRMLDEEGVDMIFGSDMMPFDPQVGLNYASPILGKDKALYYYGRWREKVDIR